MPDIEIDSPLDDTNMPSTFPVMGVTDQAQVTVTPYLNGTAGNAVAAFVAGGLWSAQLQNLTDGNYKIVAANGNVASDTVNDIEILSAPPILMPPITMPTPQPLRGVSVVKAAGTVKYFNNAPVKPDVLVLLAALKGKRRFRVVAAGRVVPVDEPGGTSGKWSIDLPFDPAKDGLRLLVQALRVKTDSHDVKGRTSNKVKFT